MKADIQYRSRIKKYSRLLEKQNETLNFYSALRFIIFVAGMVCCIYLYKTARYIFLTAAVVLFLSVFIMLVARYRRVKLNKEYVKALIEINKNSLLRLQGQWKSFSDKGLEYLKEEHPYAGDLDVFGEGSLYQMINECCTSMGTQKLCKLLSETPENIEMIMSRQHAVKELAFEIKWRQRLKAEALVALKENKNQNDALLLKWIDQAAPDVIPFMEIISKVLPAVSMLLLLISFNTAYISRGIPYTLLVIQMLLVLVYGRRLNSVLDAAFYHKKNITAYFKLIKHIEGKKFKASGLLELKAALTREQSATEGINRLVKIVNLISDRNNMLYIIINILFLWDFNCFIALEKWKRKSGRLVRGWLDTLGAMEAFSSLSVLNFENPSWILPAFTESFPVLHAREAGHPLIFKNNVCNDIIIDTNSPVLLITGSNMSGKSTYLRTAGLNLVLAYAGTVVNARKFTCSLMNMYTCMRVSDNLEKNISSFYAEILRIKEIVAASRQHQNVFFLLDEIFKGTNSVDRHAGASALINKLIADNSTGMVSTHDLELGKLENSTKGKVKNYHFQEHYTAGRLEFDYKLRKGISETRNAMYLIKMAGIEQEEKNDT